MKIVLDKDMRDRKTSYAYEVPHRISGRMPLWLDILKTARIYQIAYGKITAGGLSLYVYVGKCFRL